jgi:hypothetical protein
MSNVQLPPPPSRWGSYSLKKKVAIIAVASLIGVGIAGALSDSQSSTPVAENDRVSPSAQVPTKAPTTEAPVTEAPVEDVNIEALAVRSTLVSSGYPEFDSVPDAQYDDSGAAICKVAKNMAPISEVDAQILGGEVAQGLSEGSGNHYSVLDGAKIAGAFVGVYCPQYAPN